jgi:hypothetical protein
MSFDPIFIIGTERSGSNLLRLILNSHPEIAVPHPPHIMAYFGPIEKYYGDLAHEGNIRRLAKDIVAHVRGHIHPWPIPIEEAALLQNAAPRDLFGIYAALYEQYRAAVRKRRWGCKSTFMIHYADRILARYPESRLIWLVRDPRDVALSSRDSVFNPFHPYYTARLWTEQQELGLKLEATLRPANLLRVHYEALVANPDATIDRICRFIGVYFDPAMLRFCETEEAHTSARLARDWRNTAVPILSANANKFLEQMSADEIAIVETAAGDTMRRLGYEPIGLHMPAKRPGPLHRARYRLENELLRLSVEYRSVRDDQNQWLRWRRAIRMMTLKMRLRMSVLTRRR